MGSGSIRRKAQMMVITVFTYLITGLRVTMDSLGFENLSTPLRTRARPFMIFEKFSRDTRYSITLFGIIGLFFKIPATFRRIIAIPKGRLLPGIETGNKNGATSIKEVIRTPYSPMSPKKSSKDIPSSGISDDIPLIKSDILSFLDVFIKI